MTANNYALRVETRDGRRLYLTKYNAIVKEHITNEALVRDVLWEPQEAEAYFQRYVMDRDALYRALNGQDVPTAVALVEVGTIGLYGITSIVERNVWRWCECS